MKNSLRYPSAFIFLTLLLLPAPAYANAGVPMLALVVPGMGVSLIPIILIESFYLQRKLQITYKHSIKVMGLANIESSIIGIPVTWGLLFLIEMVTAFPLLYAADKLTFHIPELILKTFSVTLWAAWLGPSEGDIYWMLPSATLFLLIPFFFVSWWIENNRAKKMLKDHDEIAIKNITKNANLITYGIFEVIVLIWLVKALITKQV